jgi:hypothetical protein
MSTFNASSVLVTSSVRREVIDKSQNPQPPHTVSFETISGIGGLGVGGMERGGGVELNVSARSVNLSKENKNNNNNNNNNQKV